ncbi:MAG: MopE-related protein, partial [Myxococcota bacterium]
MFDTAHPSGGDSDLGTPHEDFGGPGRGSGGRSGAAGENAVDLGLALILAEDLRDDDGDGLVDDPDDTSGGGRFIFRFDAPSDVGAITIIDSEDDGIIRCVGDGTEETRHYDGAGDNAVQTVAVNCTGVRELAVELADSAAVASLTWTTPCEADEFCSEAGVCSCTDAAEICDNGVDDDGDGLVDCADPDCATGSSDATCDGVDDDCDGTLDEGFDGEGTTCGVGACAASGATTCDAGAVVDACEPGEPAANDASCDGVDDDCDGASDEDFVGEATSCGEGVCEASGETACSDGSTSDTCTPGAPTGDDSACDGLDADCDGTVDEAFASEATTCGVGACEASGATTCEAGEVGDSCAPGTPTGDDSTCDAVDNDCDGSTD